MEALYPNFYDSSSSSQSSSEWSREENKAFESALAIYGDEHDPDRWMKVASLIPGKTVSDVIKQYRELEEDVCEIEAGRVPVPGYLSPSSFTLDLFDVGGGGGREYQKRPMGSTKTSDQGRKKGVPWTEDEHRRFLKGLMKYGKGDWRNISRNFVVTKTPTQVASHAQKYFIRQQLSGVKDKRRPSIHDITTLNLASPENTFFDANKRTSSSTPIDWSHYHQQQYHPDTSNFFMGLSPYDHNASAAGLKFQAHNMNNVVVAVHHTNGFRMPIGRGIRS
ncbi:Transcription factor DIVARICATA [Linum perenne]